MKTIAIIGGGAAGLVAAVAAARSTAATQSTITVYEAADRIGKSILATGNGRCNFSNAAICSSSYHNAEFVEKALAVLSPGEVRDFFSALGLMWQEESEGRLYPLSNKASSVLDVLRFALADSGVRSCCGVEVVAVTQVEQRFLVSFSDDSSVFADAVIVACGGAIARSLMPIGHEYLNTQPVLGPLETATESLRGLNNIRVRCVATLYDTSQPSVPKTSERGEVLFRDYGVSGIAVFNLSRFAQPGDIVSLDLVCDVDEQDLTVELERRIARFGQRNAVDVCAGIAQAPVIRAVCRVAKVAADERLCESQGAALARAFKHFELSVRKIGDPRQCQVRRGGFSVEHFDPQTMQSRQCSGLYMAGEALDVDAACGGFNLHWAWMSGIIAGRAATEL